MEFVNCSWVCADGAVSTYQPEPCDMSGLVVLLHIAGVEAAPVVSAIQRASVAEQLPRLDADQRAFVPPKLLCSSVIGFNPACHQSMLWCKSQGCLVYPVDNILVVSDLAIGKQQYLAHHVSLISCCALSQDGTLLASASATPEPAGCAEVSHLCMRQIVKLRGIWTLHTATHCGVSFVALAGGTDVLTFGA